MVERVFDHFGGHINDQSDLQDAHYHFLSSTNNHQDREVESLHLQTQQLSVKFSHLLTDHLYLIKYVWALQNTLSTNLFFRALLPVPFVSSLAGINGSGKDSSSKPASDSDSESSPSTPSQSFQTCVSRGSLLEESICPLIQPSRTASIWIPAEQGPVMHPFRSPSAG